MADGKAEAKRLLDRFKALVFSPLPRGTAAALTASTTSRG